MKCNINKINEFFEGDKFDKDIKKFILKIFLLLSKDKYNFDIISAKILLLSIGFYSVEKDDDIDEDDDSYKVIDFYKLSSMSPKIRKYIFKSLFYYIKKETELNDFCEDFIYNDTKIIVPYKKWNKINRKNKLYNLNDDNIIS
jgi:hypothetical protein